MAEYSHLENSMKRMMFSAKRLSESAMQLITGDHPNEIKAAILVNQASTYASAAYSIYQVHYDRLERSDIDEVFNAFFEFTDELIQNITENHSHQWSTIEFQRFVDAFEQSCLVSPIEK